MSLLRNKYGTAIAVLMLETAIAALRRGDRPPHRYPNADIGELESQLEEIYSLPWKALPSDQLLSEIGKSYSVASCITKDIFAMRVLKRQLAPRR